MGRVKVLVGAGFAIAGIAAAALGGGYAWAAYTTTTLLDQTFTAHQVDFPIPTPLTEVELAALRAERAAALPPPADPTAPPVDPLAGLDLAAVARERAVERGRHLLESRYACGECHGADFGGGTMIDDPAIGRIRGYNLTTGPGAATEGWTAADWDRKVRHGIGRDGRGGIMPSEDYRQMSDQELADLISFLQAAPPVDRRVPPHEFGPLGKVLMATGQIPLAAQLHPDHFAPHLALPPEPGDPAFGPHLLAVCTGCHGASFEGGPIKGAPPDWLPASDLTKLDTWTWEQFEAAMRKGVRPDGSSFGVPMSMIPKYTERLSDAELRAMWTALQALP